MVNIEQIKPEIIDRLLPLKPNKIILFGSYANGKPREDSDIDLISKYKISFDIIALSTEDFLNKNDFFIKSDIQKEGIIIYE